jgi:hypothetical protein
MLFKVNGNGQPDWAVCSLYAVAIDETISLELHVIEINELVAARDAIEVSEPRQISGLMDRQDHLN